MGQWQHFLEPRQVVLQETSVSLRMMLLKMNFGGESEYFLTFFHFMLLSSIFQFYFYSFYAIINIANILISRGSPNIEMDEQTFLVNRERAVDYLNSLDKVIPQFIFF